MASPAPNQDQDATTNSPHTPTSSIPSFKLLTPEVLGNEIVTLYVGPKRKQYTVHKKLLCDGSSFFDKAFRGSFVEAHEGVMDIPDDDIGAVSSLIDFLYRGSIPKASGAVDISKSKAADRLVSLYIFAEKICMPELMDRTLDELSSSCTGGNAQLRQHDIKKIFQNTHEGSKIRAYCVAAFACFTACKDNIDEAWIEKYAQISATCPDFFVDMFRFQAKHFKTMAASHYEIGLDMLASIVGPCDFHTHEKDEDCYLKKG